MTPFTVEQIERIYDFLHRIGGAGGLIRASEFFLYTGKDKAAVEACLDKGYNFPKVTSWIRANKDDLKLVKAMGIDDGEGAMVTQIDEDSPAQLARLIPGDIVRKVNATRIKNAESFVSALKALHSGDTVRLFVNRNGMALFMAFRMP